MSAREEIAAAASTVPGVEVTPTYQLVSEVGRGYVTWLRTDYPNTFGGEDYWGVVIVLPNENAAAQAWVEEHRGALFTACSEAMRVTQARPSIDTPPDNPSQKILVLEGHRESEE